MNTKTVHNQQTVLQALWNNSATGLTVPMQRCFGRSWKRWIPKFCCCQSAEKFLKKLPQLLHLQQQQTPPDTSQHGPGSRSQSSRALAQPSGKAVTTCRPPKLPSHLEMTAILKPFLRYGFWWISIWKNSNKVCIIVIIFNLNHKCKDFQISVNIFSQNKWQTFCSSTSALLRPEKGYSRDILKLFCCICIPRKNTKSWVSF